MLSPSPEAQQLATYVGWLPHQTWAGISAPNRVTSMNIAIAILSPGAMGSAISMRLVEHGARVLTSLDGRSAATGDRARAAGMEDVSLEAIATADVILSIVPPGEALALAKGLVTRLGESRHKPVYIDCNALSPKSKTEIAGTLAETGCDIVDGAIVGAPPRPGEKGPRIYVSGDQGDRASILRTLGLDLRRIDGPIGAAAALKMSYAGINKQELGESLPQLLSKFETGIPDMYPKAYRWVAEMREIAAFLGEDKAAAMIFEGAAQLYARLATDIANEGRERETLDGFFRSS
jgi:hypothetical protein